MKKVLISVNNSRVSGIERFVLLLAKYTNKDNFDLLIAVPSYGQLCIYLEELGIKYYIFNKTNTKPYNLKGIFNIFKLFLKNRFDIVHAQAGIVPCILGKFFNVKLILEHKHGLDFTDEQIINMRYFKLIYEKTKKYFVDYTLTGCEKDRKTLINIFKYKSDKVITLYNSEDVDFFKMKNLKTDLISPKTIVIGTIGRLTYQKGQEYFIDMAKLLIDDFKNVNFRFEIYGRGENYEMLKNLILKYNLGNKVFLLNYSENIAKVMNNFDIFVLSSRYEGIPYVLLEAMSAKLPIVSTDVGGISELIQNNINGILVEKENAKLLKEAVKKLILNEELRENLSSKAYRDFKEIWTIDKTIQNIENIYNR